MSQLSEKRIALTGCMGAGKSEAGRLLAKEFPVLDCDEINAKLLKAGKAGTDKLVQAGIARLTETGDVDKGDLAARLFLDKDLKARTEAILHPLILEEVNRLSKGKPVVFVQVPLLFESGLEDQFDEVWCITCSQETALRRLQQGRSISPEEARRRWNHQMSPEKKAALSDVVIKNDGTREQLAQMLKEKVRDRIGERNQN